MFAPLLVCCSLALRSYLRIVRLVYGLVGWKLRGHPFHGSSWTPQEKCGAAEKTQLVRRAGGEDAAGNSLDFLRSTRGRPL